VNGTPYISGTALDYASDTNTVTVNAIVKNESGASMNLTVQRIMNNQPLSWIDDLCWGSSTDGGLSGQCYNSIQASNPSTTEHVQVVDAGDNGIFSAKVHPKNPDYGCGEYKYYIIQDGTIILDSIIFSVCKTASLDEVEPLSISVAPNPAKTYVKVKTNGVEGVNVKMVDVLGNVVLKETVMGTSKTIDTSNFRNGVYFITIEAVGSKPITRKLIVRQ
jgi:hypothetical protein